MQRVKDLLDKSLKDPSDGRIAQLTGTLRGWERDRMTKENPVFARFKPDAKENPDNPTVYLISTSAGEVGVNISADHLVCDLSTFDSMAQRFGRVNRFGKGNANIDVVHPTEFAAEKDDMEARRRLTLSLLKKLDRDASPAALDALIEDVGQMEIENAFAPKPRIKEATDILYDAWAMTTIEGSLPGRPPVAEYLHGVEDPKQAETQVAWRDEVQLLDEEQLAMAPPAGLLEDYPLKPHELLHDTTVRVVAELERIVERLDGESAGRSEALCAWVVDQDGTVECCSLSRLVERDHRGEFKVDLHNCTVILPPRAGGLTTGNSAGLLDGSKAWMAEAEYDIADHWTDQAGRPLRSRVRRKAESIGPPKKLGAKARLVRQLVLSMPEDEEEVDQEIGDQSSLPDSSSEPEASELQASEFESLETDEVAREDGSGDQAAANVAPLQEVGALDEETAAEENNKPRLWCWFVRVNVPEGDVSKHAREPINLQAHLEEVSCAAADLAGKLKLPKEIRQALAEAGYAHDLGKNRRFWQLSIGNTDAERVLAKSGSRGRGLEIDFSYRHEFGSLIDLQREWLSNGDSDSQFDWHRDLLLHFVAAHHGRARSHFPADECEARADLAIQLAIAEEVPRRYARLHANMAAGAWLISSRCCARPTTGPAPDRRRNASSLHERRVL